MLQHQEYLASRGMASQGSVEHIRNQLAQARRDAESELQQLSPAAPITTTGGPPPASPPPAPSVAAQPRKGQTAVNLEVVKIADANIVTYDYEQSSIEELEKMYFQNIGGTEILTVARHDNVGGEETSYALVDNLKELNAQFNPLNILTTESIHKHFNRFAIDMTQRIGSINQAIYSDEETPMLVVYLYDIKPDEYVQIQVAENAEDFEFGEGVEFRNYYGEVK